MNNFQVKINNIDYSSYAVFPFNYGELLDERLDEAYLTLRNVPKDIFYPLEETEVEFRENLYNKEVKITDWEISPRGSVYEYTATYESGRNFATISSVYATGFISTPEIDITDGVITVTAYAVSNVPTFQEVDFDLYAYDLTKQYYIVANDDAHETPIGSGLYTHKLYLIERTKLLEGRICDSLTFTNSQGVSYLKDQPANVPTNIGGSGFNNISEYPDAFLNDEIHHFILSGGEWTLKSINEVCEQVIPKIQALVPSYISLTPQSTFTNPVTQALITSSVIVEHNGETETYSGLDEKPVIQSASGTYSVIYLYALTPRTSGGTQSNILFNYRYDFETIANYYPLKKWTVSDCIGRILQLSKPLNYKNGVEETPDYSLLASERTQYQDILSPEFTMTQCTLRDQLRVIGGYIHAEPRLDENNNVIFDDYGSDETETITAPYVTKQANIDINQYCTSVDTSASNIVNSLDYAQGVIYVPDEYNYKSMRTTSVNVRVSKDNAIATTPLKINKPVKVKAGVINNERTGWRLEPVDITPYVFEKTQYDSNLSSYSSVYPYSKAYAIWYEQGGKSLGGFFFKPDRAIASAFQNYAIINIIKAVSGQTISWTSDTNEPCVAVQIEYEPIYDTRFAHSKPYVINDNRSIIYNQSENLIETSYYGENVKGVVARLGNVEKSLTFILPNLDSVPKVGRLYTLDGEDYYISAVSVEYEANYIKCQIALSKDFNRLSQYVGINSNKRVYEVSEKQAYARNTLWGDKIVIGDEIEEDDTNISDTALETIVKSVGQFTGEKISIVQAYGTNKGLNPVTSVRLPVVSSAFGNVMTFSWAYKDNYSAGEQSNFEESGNVSGFWQQDLPYCDFYGRIYYYRYFLNPAEDLGESAQVDFAFKYPQNTVTVGVGEIESNDYVILRKDSREILQCNYQIELVSNRKELIIGSAFASTNVLVRGIDETLVGDVVLLPKKINKFKNQFTPDELQGLSHGTLTPYGNRWEIQLPPTVPYEVKAYAVITSQTAIQTQVSDDDGNVTTQTTYKGGELLIGSNDITIDTIYFSRKRR